MRAGSLSSAAIALPWKRRPVESEDFFQRERMRDLRSATSNTELADLALRPELYALEEWPRLF
jgi:hypothetical protein